MLDSGEVCDDGNFANHDACSVNCSRLRCGDGVLDPDEECDDGNVRNGDLCSSTCRLPGCGNGVVEPGEQCDDGNAEEGDGCDRLCGIPGCPNGVIDAGEECDDGNLTDNDGCARNCTFPDCSNAILETGEECDDGNASSCDGCSNACVMEADADDDDFPGDCDNCPLDYNPSQRDRDDNGIGDACDDPVQIATPSGEFVLISMTPDSATGVLPSRIRALTIRYSSVAADGTTRIQELEAPPGALLDSNFKVSSLGILLHLGTDSVFQGAIEVCLTYDDTGLQLSEESALAFLHEENGVLTDRTSSHDIDANILCASVTSFSAFALGLATEGPEDGRLSLRLGSAGAHEDKLGMASARTRPSSTILVDPAITGLTFTILRQNTEIFSRTIPASGWQADESRRSFRFRDRTGTAARGLTIARVRRSGSGSWNFRLKGTNLDLREAHGTNALTLRWDAGATTLSTVVACASTPTRDGAKLACRAQ